MPYKDPEKAKQAKHESYVRNRARIEAKTKERVARNKAVSVSLMTPCEHCGEFDVAFMDWHHLNPEDKINSVSYILHKRGLDMLLQEIDKCICLCSNCHRRLHFYN